jgi:hypothetical protein
MYITPKNNKKTLRPDGKINIITQNNNIDAKLDILQLYHKSHKITNMPTRRAVLAIWIFNSRLLLKVLGIFLYLYLLYKNAHNLGK